MVYSASYIFSFERTGDGYYFVRKQTAFSLLGILAGSIALLVRESFWKEKAYLLLIASGLMIALVWIPGIGVKSGGATRWIHLGLFTFQPAELAKFALMVYFAKQLAEKRDRLHKFSAGVLSLFVAPLPILFLLLLQPDFGSSMIIVMAGFALMFLARVPLKYLFLTLGGGGLMATLLILTSPYRMARVSTFFDPWSDPSGKGFQIVQSLLSFNNGGIFGMGLGNGKSKLFYLPEAHNDFIFSVIGEELGFVGIAGVILVFLLLIYRGFLIAKRARETRGSDFGYFLASAITILIAIQALMNMAVALGVAPTKGTTLPFISSGGSALLMNLFLIGVLIRIDLQNKQGLSRS